MFCVFRCFSTSSCWIFLPSDSISPPRIPVSQLIQSHSEAGCFVLHLSDICVMFTHDSSCIPLHSSILRQHPRLRYHFSKKTVTTPKLEPRAPQYQYVCDFSSVAKNYRLLDSYCITIVNTPPSPPRTTPRWNYSHYYPPSFCRTISISISPLSFPPL
jgi:hypothetical protein